MRKLFWNKLAKIEQNQLLQREQATEDEALGAQVKEIIQQVKEKGDQALNEFTLKFDDVKLENLCVSASEFSKAVEELSMQTTEALQFAINRIKANATSQIPENTLVENQGVRCERLWRPIARVGLYVPGGTAVLVSTLLMLAVSAKVAGCEEVIICTPVRKDGSIMPAILVAAKLCGVSKVFKVGGAQAIAAMAYGTSAIPKVDKIFGPGNRYVTQAKLFCAQDPFGASIDLPAGPSEILVIADKQANPSFVAADLLSQAEHDIASQVFLVSDSEELVDEVIDQIQVQLTQLPRKSIALACLQKSAAIIVKDIAQAIALSNMYAPEHLSLQVQNPRQYICAIQSAGTIFVGPWTAETLGDYVTGANHVLPTQGAAKSSSGLSVLDFMKTIGVQEVCEQGLAYLAPKAVMFAKLEALFAHENAVLLRQEVLNG